MKWKKFKQERISLNYTVMLLPHSQKKPIHFKTPVWTFGLLFLGILTLSGTCLFFAGSRHQLKQVQEEKAQLELEWEDLAKKKQMADQENELLRQEREIQENELKTQEEELKQLEQKTRDTIKELEELVERENQIREELGLQQTADIQESSKEDEEETEEISHTQNGTGGENLLMAQAEERVVQTVSANYASAFAQNNEDFQAIQLQLNDLQASLLEKSSQFDQYSSVIEEKKAAAAAEIARKLALRDTIVENALQFLGNAYVYGGNNPNSGVDCSGFTKYIMANIAGVYLNRTAAEQATQGRAVSISEARPGDLVFYSNGQRVNHVAIYIGNGRIVHASNERVGITTSDMYYRTPVKVVNVLGD